MPDELRVDEKALASVLAEAKARLADPRGGGALDIVERAVRQYAAALPPAPVGEAVAYAEKMVRSLHHYGCPPDSRLQEDVDGDVRDITDAYRRAFAHPLPSDAPSGGYVPDTRLCPECGKLMAAERAAPPASPPQDAPVGLSAVEAAINRYAKAVQDYLETDCDAEETHFAKRALLSLYRTALSGVPAKEAGEPKADTRIQTALELARSYGSTDGAHHKMWLIDQMVRALLPNDGEYEAWVVAQKAGEDGPDTYEWDEGIAP